MTQRNAPSRTLLLNISGLFGANVFALVVGLAIKTIFARYLGPTGLGWYTLALYFPALISIFLDLGLSISNIYFVGRGQLSLQEAYANSMSVGIFCSFIAGTSYFVLIPWLQQGMLHGLPLNLIILGALSLPLSLINAYGMSLLAAQERLKQYSLVKIFQNFSLVAFALALVIACRWGALGALLSYLISAVLSLAGIFYLLSNSLNFSFPFNFTKLKMQILYGIKGHLGNIIQFFNYRLDVLFIAYFLSPREVGLYALATTMAESLWQIANSAQTALFPRIASSQDTANITLKVQTGVVAVTTLGALFLLIVGKQIIIILFSKAFLESYSVMIWLLPGIIALTFGKVLSADLVGRGHPWVGTIASGIALVPTIPLYYYLIPLLGLKGAAISSSISYMICGFILATFFHRYCQTSFGALVATLNPLVWYRLGANLIPMRQRKAS